MSDATDRHTQGEWYVGDGRNALIVYAADGYAVADAVTYHGRHGDVGAANARLIAAAPILLALARQYASECGECSGSGVSQDTNENCESCRDIRSVIARATNSEATP